MDRVFQALRPFIRRVARQPLAVLVPAVLLTALGLHLSLKLRIDADLSRLIPPDYPSVQALEQLRRTVGGESDVAVVLESASFAASVALADSLIPRALALQDTQGPFFTRHEFRRDTEFMRDNALYFATDDELDQLQRGLEEALEEARLRASPLYVPLDDEDDGSDPAANLRSLAAQWDRGEYPVSADSTTLVVRFYPAASQTDIASIERLYAALERLVEQLQPTSFHPTMEVTLAGSTLRRLVEVQRIRRDVAGSFGTGVAAVMLAVIAFFTAKTRRAGARSPVAARLARAPVAALLIGLPFLMSLSWTFAVAYMAFGDLNLMTSTLGLVLFGLGIDYGIHFYARYLDERAGGATVDAALETCFVSTGQAIAISALTTALALYVLVWGDFRGFSQFGAIAGTGILFALVAMVAVLPALIALAERGGLLVSGATTKPRPLRRPLPAAGAVCLAGLALTGLALTLLPQLQFEYRFGRFEPRYDEYNARRDKVRRVFGRQTLRNPAYIVLDEAAEAEAVARELRRRAAADTLSPTIGAVVWLQERFPMDPTAQDAKLERLAAIRRLLDEPLMRQRNDPELARLRRAAGTRRPIAPEEVPELLRKRFQARDGSLGHFVMVYPSVGLSDGRQSIAFAQDVGRVEVDGRNYFAGSSSLVAADMLVLMRREAPWMVAATALAVALLMRLSFGSWRWAGVALLPLGTGVLWMLLGMRAGGIDFNFYNLIALPAIIGIGNDAGAHLVHRYRELGTGSVRRVLATTGHHVTLGTLTTAMGFSGMLLSFHPGLRSLGEAAVIGLAATWLSSLPFLGAVLQWSEGRRPQEPPAASARQPANRARHSLANRST